MCQVLRTQGTIQPQVMTSSGLFTLFDINLNNALPLRGMEVE